MQERYRRFDEKKNPFKVVEKKNPFLWPSFTRSQQQQNPE
jgi:hypothetical protein